jgi:lactate dehydrogenase-like 2-hydroxyacid dehydrogenase
MLAQAEAVITWLPGHELSTADVAALGRADLIQLLTAGADHVDFAALPPRAKVADNVGAYADPIAEHVLAMTLALAKRLAHNHTRLAEGFFDLAETLRLRGTCGSTRTSAPASTPGGTSPGTVGRSGRGCRSWTCRMCWVRRTTPAACPAW